MNSNLVSIIFITLILTITPAAAQNKADFNTSNSCDFLQPSIYVTNYFRTVENSNGAELFPRPDNNCLPDGLIAADSEVKVHAESGDWRFVENKSDSGWGWVKKSVLDANSEPFDPDSPPPVVPGDATANLTMLKATPYRNTNHDNSAYTTTPSVSLPINDLLVPWNDYEGENGRLPSQEHFA